MRRRETQGKPLRLLARIQRNALLRPKKTGESWWRRKNKSQRPAQHPDLQKPGRPFSELRAQSISD